MTTQRPRQEAEHAEFVSVIEGADYLGISRRALSRLLLRGELSYAGVDPLDRRIKLLRRSDLDALLARSTRRPRRAAPADQTGR